jgi:hypothetical protein
MEARCRAVTKERFTMDMDEEQSPDRLKRREEWRQLFAKEHEIAMLMESPEWAYLSAERQAEVAAFHNELVAWLNVVHIEMEQLSQRFEAFRERFLRSIQDEGPETNVC